ncbi:MAG TPA: glycerol-3-phosphate 1-O-acyltransferase PlsY [Acidobacteriaceae bacterium]
MPTYVTALAIAYLLGSIPSGYLLVRTICKEDIRSVGSGNIGATNVLRSGSKGVALATLLFDLGKGYLAVSLAHSLALRNGIADPFQFMTLAAVVAVVAHIYPIWLGFKGGKGVATAFGVFLALEPYAALSLLGVFVVLVAITRIVSLSSIVAAASFFFFGPYFAHGPLSRVTLAGLFFIPVLVIAKHHQNIGRLLHGTEHRFGKPKKAAL